MTDQALLRRVAQSLPELAAVRQSWVAAGLSLLGLGWAQGGILRARYELLLWPYDTVEARARMAQRQSSCAVTWECEARALGVDDDRLYRPIEPRTVGRDDPSTAGRDWPVLTLGLEIAREHGALRTVAPGMPLEPGDGVILGVHGDPHYSRGTSTEEHELTIVLLEGDVVHSVDGGQPGIELRSRRRVEVDGEVWLADLDAGIGADGRPMKGRRVSHVIDADRLRYRA